MVSIIDENYEIYDDIDDISSEIKQYLSFLGLGIGPPLEPQIPIIINE